MVNPGVNGVNSNLMVRNGNKKEFGQEMNLSKRKKSPISCKMKNLIVKILKNLPLKICSSKGTTLSLRSLSKLPNTMSL